MRPSARRAETSKADSVTQDEFRQARHPGTVRALVILVAVALLAAPIIAQAQWVSLGPKGGDVGALAVDPATPSTLYAGMAGGGVYKSTNNGVTWTLGNNGLTNRNVTALAIDPITPTTLYAGTGGSGVFKSTNGGTSWTNVGPTGSTIRALAIDPTTPATIFAGEAAGYGVFKSTNGGAS